MVVNAYADGAVDVEAVGCFFLVGCGRGGDVEEEEEGEDEEDEEEDEEDEEDEEEEEDAEDEEESDSSPELLSSSDEEILGCGFAGVCTVFLHPDTELDIVGRSSLFRLRCSGCPIDIGQITD